MKKLVISKFEQTNTFSIYFLNTEMEHGIQFLQENLSYQSMLRYSELLINQNNMNDQDRVRIDSYNEKGFLHDITNFTINEFYNTFFTE